MPNPENENFYDTEIAPVLKSLALKCDARDMPFLAAVQYEDESVGRTVFHKQIDFRFLLIEWAMKCDGNVDALISAIIKHANQHGHSSMYLQMLGCTKIVEPDSTFVAMTITKK